MKKFLKIAGFLALILLLASLMVGCVEQQRQQVGQDILSEGGSYSIPNSSYSFVVKEINSGGWGNSASVLVDVCQNGQFVKKSFVFQCHGCSCFENCELTNAKIDNFEVAFSHIGTNSVEFLIFKKPE